VSGLLADVHNDSLVAALLAGQPEAVADALPGATLLIPASSGGTDTAVLSPTRGPGGRRLLPGFTDLEALRAWDRAPAETAIALPAARVGELLPTGVGMLLVNPAGPGTFLVGGEALGTVPGAARSRNGHDAIGAALVDPDARAPVRARARDAHRAARAARERGELAIAAAALRESLQALNQLKDHLHGAAAGVELAAVHAAAGEHATAFALFADAGERFAALGELDLAVDALLDGAEAALAVGDGERAEELSVLALELVAGAAVSERIISMWRRLA
jgi:hypothetical protein